MKDTILIVEDDETLRGLVKEGLLNEGFEVLEAADGAAGLKMANEQKPTLMLLDINLPAISGLTILKKIRESAWGKQLPVLVMTALEPDDQTMWQITVHEPSYYLVKSRTTLTEIIEKVKETVEKSKQK